MNHDKMKWIVRKEIWEIYTQKHNLLLLICQQQDYHKSDVEKFYIYYIIDIHITNGKYI